MVCFFYFGGVLKRESFLSQRKEKNPLWVEYSIPEALRRLTLAEASSVHGHWTLKLDGGKNPSISINRYLNAGTYSLSLALWAAQHPKADSSKCMSNPPCLRIRGWSYPKDTSHAMTFALTESGALAACQTCFASKSWLNSLRLRNPKPPYLFSLQRCFNPCLWNLCFSHSWPLQQLVHAFSISSFIPIGILNEHIV